MKKYVLILAGILFAFSSGTACAEMYMYMEDGVVVFTDRPNHEKSISLSQYSAAMNKPTKPEYYYDKHINNAARKYGLDPKLIKAVIRVESNFNERAISHKGAMGLMQLMPETASELGVFNAFNARDNIDGGSRYLKRLITKFDGDLRLALAAYNAGPTAVIKHGTIPPYKETRNYVSKIFSIYKGKRNLKTASKVKKPSVYKVVLDDGTILFTNDETLAKRASKL